MNENKRANWITKIGLTLLTLMAISAPVMASNITLSDLQLIGNQVMVYEITETGTTYIGTFNSTDTIPITDATDYTFVFKPDAPSVAFTSPNSIITFIADNIDMIWSSGLAFALLIGFILIVFAIARR